MSRGTPDKYAAIIEAAVAEIARCGYGRARMAAIAQAAGVAAGTPYLYFKGKQDLLVAAFRERVGRIVRTIQGAMATTPDPREQLRRLVHGQLQGLAADSAFAVLAQIEARHSDPETRRQINAVMEELYFSWLGTLIQRGQAAGAFRRDVDWRLIRNMVFGTLDQTVTAWVLSEFRWDLVAQAEPTYELLAAAITCAGMDDRVTGNDAVEVRG